MLCQIIVPVEFTLNREDRKMKTLIILAVSIMTIWNSSNAFAMSAESSNHPIDMAELELSNISVQFQNPLRDVDANLASYSKLINTFDKFKLYNVEFTKGLLNKVKNQGTLSGAELFTLRRTITTYYKINKKILDFAKAYDFGGFKMSKTFATENHNTPLIKAHLVWLSGHLLVLDHLEIMHAMLYEADGKFRRIVKNALKDKNLENEGTAKTLNDLIKMNKYTVEKGESLKFTQQINLVRAIQEDLRKILAQEPSATWLVDTIVFNKTSSDMAQGRTKFGIENYSFLDSLIDLYAGATNWLSSIFGNIMGSIHTRKGHLFNNEMALDIAKENLIPMDILLEKSSFVLTDKFIPGHFGHVAVYLGTKKQLEEIDMWNHPDIIPYHEDIEKGRNILEAVRSGVRLATLEDFMNIDELSIIRKEDGLKDPNLLIEQITRGMDQVGKAYDFNFDIATLDKIVCSELIYITFGNVQWPTKYRLGRASITPDDVAEILFQKNTKFKVQNFMVAKEDHRVELVNLNYIADEMDYEKRTANGNPIEDEQDKTNSYWKKETKCYMVSEATSDKPYNDDFTPSSTAKRVCDTTYKEFYYEERTSI